MSLYETGVVVGQPPAVVAEHWNSLPSLAGRLDGVVVSRLSESTTRWSIPMTAGVRTDLLVRIVGRAADDIVWVTTSRPEVAGRVTFRPVGEGSTAVRLLFEVAPHGMLERFSVLAGTPQRLAEAFLSAFKKAVEDDRGIVNPSEVSP